MNNVERVNNQPVDEVIPLSDGSGDDVPSPEDDDHGGATGGAPPKPRAAGGASSMGGAASAAPAAGNQSVWLRYNPADYRNLNISPEIKDLFKHITNYIPEVYELDTQLKPFIPEYIPAIGEVDAFIKIPRPDGEEETLGISIVDEPKLNQSKRAVIDRMLEEHGLVQRRSAKVHSVTNAHKNTKEIQNWIDNVDKIQKERFAPSVVLSNKMPDIDTLMQAWDPEFERFLDENPLPDGNLDIPVEDLARYACSLLDIPVHEQNKEKSLIESTYLLFSLYSAFNQYYQGQGKATAQV